VEGLRLMERHMADARAFDLLGGIEPLTGRCPTPAQSEEPERTRHAALRTLARFWA
jgi:hypothetical protein